MQQIFLYVIIALLLLNGVTGFKLYSVDKELSEVKAAYANCKQANTTNNTTIDIKDTVTVANDETCQSQLDTLRKAEAEARNKKDGLQSLYDEAKRKADALKAKNNALVNENMKLKQPVPIVEMTDDEAIEIVQYLDTLVPVSIERSQLHRIRDSRQD
jgi:cell division protein FtsB